jgi:CBS domain containing-hemolysin-like protein
MLLFTCIFSVLAILFFTAVRSAFSGMLKLRLELLGRNINYSGRAASLFLRETTMVSLSIKSGRTLFLLLAVLSASLLWTRFQEPVWNSMGMLLVFVLVFALLLFLLADAFIANITRLYPYAMLRMLAPLFLFSYGLFWPSTRLLFLLRKNIMMRHEKGTPGKTPAEDMSEDFEELVNSLQQRNSHLAQEPEVQILRNALDFQDEKAGTCMIPRSEVVAVEINASIEELKQKFTATRLTRILIYRESIENIVGYVHSFEMFRKPVSIISIIRPVIVVPESIPVHDVLALFIKQRRSIALVVDEYGGTSGILTMEDVIEELFGEIDDEHDNDQHLEKKLNEVEYLFSARLEIDYLNEKYKLDLPVSQDYHTLGGLVMQLSEGLPRPKQKLFSGHFRLEVVEVAENRIETVKLILK